MDSTRHARAGHLSGFPHGENIQDERNGVTHKWGNVESRDGHFFGAVSLARFGLFWGGDSPMLLKQIKLDN